MTGQRAHVLVLAVGVLVAGLAGAGENMGSRGAMAQETAPPPEVGGEIPAKPPGKVKLAGRPPAAAPAPPREPGDGKWGLWGLVGDPGRAEPAATGAGGQARESAAPLAGGATSAPPDEAAARWVTQAGKGSSTPETSDGRPQQGVGEATGPIGGEDSSPAGGRAPPGAEGDALPPPRRKPMPVAAGVPSSAGATLAAGEDRVEPELRKTGNRTAAGELESGARRADPPRPALKPLEVPFEPAADPRFPPDALVPALVSVAALLRAGYEVRAFDSRNRLVLQRGTSIALCLVESAQGGAYLDGSSCYMTQRKPSAAAPSSVRARGRRESNPRPPKMTDEGEQP